MSDTENLLLTFGDVKGDVFTDAVTASRGSATAALLLGEALMNPQKVGRMKQVGVTFSRWKAWRLRRLQRRGDLVRAQKLILREVQRQGIRQ